MSVPPPGWDLLRNAANSAAAECLHVGGCSYHLAAGEELPEYAVGLVVLGDAQLGRDDGAVYRIEIGVRGCVSFPVNLPRVGQVRHLDYFQPAPGCVGCGIEPGAILSGQLPVGVV